MIRYLSNTWQAEFQRGGLLSDVRRTLVRPRYYTTFDYGAPKSHAAGRTPPAVWVAESTEQCTPRAASTHVQLVQHGPVQAEEGDERG